MTGGSAWNEQDDEALLAQGRASAAAGAFFPGRVLPQLPDSERLLSGPDGWVLLGHGRLGDNARDAVVTRFKTVAYGGSPLNDGEAESLLASVGLVDVHHLLTPRACPPSPWAAGPQSREGAALRRRCLPSARLARGRPEVADRARLLTY